MSPLPPPPTYQYRLKYITSWTQNWGTVQGVVMPIEYEHYTQFSSGPRLSPILIGNPAFSDLHFHQVLLTIDKGNGFVDLNWDLPVVGTCLAVDWGK